jgi:hypothetical protein
VCQLIGLISGRLVLGLRHAVFKPDDHQGAGYSAAGLAHARHPPAKGTRHLEGQLAPKPQLLSETGEHGLRSRKPFTKTADCLLYPLHRASPFPGMIIGFEGFRKFLEKIINAIHIPIFFAFSPSP